MIFIVIACEKEPLPVNNPEPPVVPEKPINKDVELAVEVKETAKFSAQVFVKTTANSAEILSQGVYYSEKRNPNASASELAGDGEIAIEDLLPGTKYYLKAFAKTEEKTFYSQEISFETAELVVSFKVSDIGKRSAVINLVLDDDLPEIKESGIYYSKYNEVPKLSDKKLEGASDLQLELLSYETAYFVKAYLKLGNRTYFSDVKKFNTAKLPTVKDYDGNTYRVIEMNSTKGIQYYLLDNFKGTHFANGDPIPEITDTEEWTKQTGPAYCHYDNDPKHTEVSGALYNWYVGSDPRGLIIGWRPPTDEEWFEIMYIFTGHIGGLFKEEGTEHWKAPNKDATNETGFTAIPSGVREPYSGNFVRLKEYTAFNTYDNYGDGYWARSFCHNKNEFGEPGVDMLSGNAIRLRKVE